MKWLLLRQKFGLCLGEASRDIPASDMKMDGRAWRRSSPVIGTGALVKFCVSWQRAGADDPSRRGAPVLSLCHEE
eukprot:8157185-Ditylum_brightwellii.AAC.1